MTMHLVFTNLLLDETSN